MVTHTSHPPPAGLYGRGQLLSSLPLHAPLCRCFASSTAARARATPGTCSSCCSGRLSSSSRSGRSPWPSPSPPGTAGTPPMTTTTTHPGTISRRIPTSEQHTNPSLPPFPHASLPDDHSLVVPGTSLVTRPASPASTSSGCVHPPASPGHTLLCLVLYLHSASDRGPARPLCFSLPPHTGCHDHPVLPLRHGGARLAGRGRGAVHPCRRHLLPEEGETRTSQGRACGSSTGSATGGDRTSSSRAAAAVPQRLKAMAVAARFDLTRLVRSLVCREQQAEQASKAMPQSVAWLIRIVGCCVQVTTITSPWPRPATLTDLPQPAWSRRALPDVLNTVWLTAAPVPCLWCCCQCCLWCVEKCLKFINKNAYIQVPPPVQYSAPLPPASMPTPHLAAQLTLQFVCRLWLATLSLLLLSPMPALTTAPHPLPTPCTQTAIYGTPFCTSAKKAFFLIARNISRIAAVSLVSEFVIVIGKVRLYPLPSQSLSHPYTCS